VLRDELPASEFQAVWLGVVHELRLHVLQAGNKRGKSAAAGSRVQLPFRQGSAQHTSNVERCIRKWHCISQHVAIT
jgi:hypothetical protein